jgi:hypothetical protein
VVALLIDPADQTNCEPHHAATLPRRRDDRRPTQGPPNITRDNPVRALTSAKSTPPRRRPGARAEAFSALHKMRRLGAGLKALRPLRGRALRPSLDPDAYLDVPTISGKGQKDGP